MQQLLAVALTLALLAAPARAACPPAWDPAQVYDARDGKTWWCVDPDPTLAGPAVACTITFAAGARTVDVELAAPAAERPIEVAVPAALYGAGEGSAAGWCADAAGTRTALASYPSVAFPPALSLGPPGTPMLLAPRIAP